MQNINLLFEEHKHLISKTIWRNRPLLTALRLEDEDVAQQLAIKMLSAIQKFNPDRSASMATHIRYSLQYEILNIKRRHKPHGIAGVPKGDRLNFLCLDYTTPDGYAVEIPTDDDVSGVEVSEMLECLSDAEAEVVDLKMQGYRIRRKAHIAALDNARRKCAVLMGACKYG